MIALRRLSALVVLACALLLSSCKRESTTSPDEASDVELDGATPELVVQAGSNHLITDVEFSPDGRWLASTSVDGLLKLFDVRMGKEWRTLPGAAGPLYKASWSPDQRRIAAAGLGKSVHVWDVESGRELARLPGHSGWVWDVEFSPDGRWLASGAGVGDSMAAIWDVDGKSIRHALTHPSGVSDVVWSRDGKFLITAAAQVHVWNAETGGQLGVIEVDANEEGLRSLFISPDGSLLAIASKHEAVHVYDTTSWSAVTSIAGVAALGFDPQTGELLGLQAGSVARFDARSGRRTGGWSSGAVNQRDAALTPDGRLLASFDEMNLHLFDAAGGTHLRTIESTFWRHVGGTFGNDTELLYVAWSPTAPVVATAGFDGMLRVLDLRAGVAPRAVAAGAHVERDSEPAILGWAPAKVGLVSGVGFSPDGASILTMDGQGITQWDTSTLERVRQYPTVNPNAFALSPDSRSLAVAHDARTITVFDARTGAVLRTGDVGSLDADCQRGRTTTISAYNPIGGLGWSADGHKLFAIYRETATFVEFDANSLTVGKGGCAHTNRVNAVSWSRTGDRVAVGGGVHMLAALGGELAQSDNSIFVASTEGEMPIVHRLAGHELAVMGLAFAPDGKTLASSGADRTARLWDLETGSQLATLTGHGAEVDSVTFSHDGRYLATASYDLSVKVWDVASRELVATIVTLGPDGFVIETADHYYTASRQGLHSVAFRLGEAVVPVELFDLRLNRPDLALARFGYAPRELIELYERMYHKRLRKMGIEESALRPDYHVPTVEIRNEVPVATAGDSVDLDLLAEDSRFDLDRLMVYVNDVPIHGSAGISLDRKARSVERSLAVALTPGRNKIQVSVLNEAGTESLKDTVEVVSTAPARTPALHVIAIGVSQYADQRLNLEYAAKDARDVGALFKAQKGRWAEVSVTEIVDSQATRENILATRKQLEATRIDDQVVVFVAGHGMLDAELDYWFVTHDFDTRNPSKRGMSYEQLEGLLDGIPARRKLLLIDTCHSGEVDGDAVTSVPPAPGGARGGGEQVKVATSFRGLVYDSGLTVQPSADLLAQLFADLRRGSGAMVISSASGAEFALESAKWNNGVFTYSVLQGLSSGSADQDGDRIIRVSELRDYVVHEVQRLTRGAQTPTSRRENLEFDFTIF